MPHPRWLGKFGSLEPFGDGFCRESAQVGHLVHSIIHFSTTVFCERMKFGPSFAEVISKLISKPVPFVKGCFVGGHARMALDFDNVTGVLVTTASQGIEVNARVLPVSASGPQDAVAGIGLDCGTVGVVVGVWGGQIIFGDPGAMLS